MNDSVFSKNLWDILDFNKPIIYLDIESSQLVSKKPRIIQIAAINVLNDKVIDEINYWSNPMWKVEKRILRMVGRTQSFLDQKKSNKFVYHKILEFIGDIEQVIVFGDYDQVILDYNASFHSLKQIKVIDIQEAFYNKLISIKNCQISLKSLAYSLGLDNMIPVDNVHNAILDARMLFKVINASLSYDTSDLLNKIFIGMLRPKKEDYRKSSYNDIQFKNFFIKKNFKINYLNISINNTYEKDENNLLTNKYVIIKCEFFQISNDAIITNNLKQQHQFKGDGAGEDEKKQKIINEFCLTIIKEYMNNVIFIYENNFNLLINNFQNHYGKLPVYYYIPIIYLKAYLLKMKKVNNLEDFFHDEEVIKNIFKIIGNHFFKK
ncbi:MAG: 3'-5' exonuclease [Mycoplasmoidaceae bacterium]